MIKLRGWPKRIRAASPNSLAAKSGGRNGCKTQSRQTDGLRPRAGDFRGSLGRDLPSSMKGYVTHQPRHSPPGLLLYPQEMQPEQGVGFGRRPLFSGAFAVPGSEVTKANAPRRDPGDRHLPTWCQYPPLRQSAGFAPAVEEKAHRTDPLWRMIAGCAVRLPRLSELNV